MLDNNKVQMPAGAACRGMTCSQQTMPWGLIMPFVQHGASQDVCWVALLTACRLLPCSVIA